MHSNIKESAPAHKDKNIKIAFYIAATFSVVASPFMTMGTALVLDAALPLLSSITSMLFVGAWLICAIAVPAMGAPRIFLWQTINAPIFTNCLKVGIFWAIVIGFPFVLIISSIAGPTASQFFERLICGVVACILMGAIYAINLACIYLAVYQIIKKINP